MDKLKNIHFSRYEVIGLAWGIFVILLVVVLIAKFLTYKKVDYQPKPIDKPIKVVVTSYPLVTSPKPVEGQLFFTKVPSVSAMGKSYDVDVMINTNGKKLDGSDVIVTFDPVYGEVLNVKESDLFTLVPVKTIDNEKGTVRVTAFQPKDDQEFTGNQLFFTLSIKAKKSGTTQLDFAFQQGKTNLSTLVEKGTSKNILDSVGSAKIVIK